MADANPSRISNKAKDAPPPPAVDAKNGVKKDERGLRYTDSVAANGNVVRTYLD